MVPAELLQQAVDQLPKWNPNTVTRATWVNWRDGFQIKINWYDGAALVCYLDFKKDVLARDAVLKRVFEAHAATGQKPKTINGHGWSALDYTFSTGQFISANEVAELVNEMGFECSVIYVQESVSARPVFAFMGIPLMAGEMGKEWVGGEFIPYSRAIGKCL